MNKFFVIITSSENEIKGRTVEQKLGLLQSLVVEDSGLAVVRTLHGPGFANLQAG